MPVDADVIHHAAMLVTRVRTQRQEVRRCLAARGARQLLRLVADERLVLVEQVVGQRRRPRVYAVTERT